MELQVSRWFQSAFEEICTADSLGRQTVCPYRDPAKDQAGLPPSIKVLASLNLGPVTRLVLYRVINWPSPHHPLETGAQEKSMKNIATLAMNKV